MIGPGRPDPGEPVLRPPASFLGAPTGDLEDLAAGDVALVGLFLDHGDATGFGARFAARQIRYASRPAYGVPLEPVATPARHGRVLDLGDLNVFPLEPARQREALERQFAALLGSGARFVVVGGAQELGAIVVAAAGHAGAAGRALSPVALHGDGAHALRLAPPAGELFVTVNLAPLLDAAADRRAKTRLIESIHALPPGRVRAAHLTGLAPELDLSARAETALAARVLEALARQLAQEAPPCR
jgi:hypothetical protein